VAFVQTTIPKPIFLVKMEWSYIIKQLIAHRMSYLRLTIDSCRTAFFVLVSSLLIGGVASDAWSQPMSETAPIRGTEINLRVVGGLADLYQFTQYETPFWTQRLPEISQGKFSATIVPFDRAGIPGAEMLRLIQLGVVPFGTALLSSFTSQYPEYTAPDLAGLNPDITTLRSTVNSFRPFLEKNLREKHGIELLAIYVYPAQMVFCKKQISSLSDLAGRKVRVSSSTQADFISALDAIPVRTEFKKIIDNINSGNVECAITGSASGNTLGLHKITTHLHVLPINWGLAVFGANKNAWQKLPADLRDLLKKEMPKLEADIWSASELETSQGIECNRGADACQNRDKGKMTLVSITAQDEQKRLDILARSVVPNWIERCGKRCVNIWNETIAPVRGIKAVEVP
jgi:TRAP-type C4-dicarboxylate transport system substrate-binding protein